MEWIEAKPLPSECQNFQEEDCWECDYAGKRWYLPEADELKLRRKHSVYYQYIFRTFFHKNNITKIIEDAGGAIFTDIMVLVFQIWRVKTKNDCAISSTVIPDRRETPVLRQAKLGF